MAGCRSLKGRTAQLVSSQERSERRRERRGQLAVREDGMATAAASQRSQNSQYGQKVHQSHFTSLRSAPRCCTRCPPTPPTRLTSSDLPPSLDHHFSCHSAVAHAKWSFCCFSSSHTSPLQVIRICTLSPVCPCLHHYSPQHGVCVERQRSGHRVEWLPVPARPTSESRRREAQQQHTRTRTMGNVTAHQTHPSHSTSRPSIQNHSHIHTPGSSTHPPVQSHVTHFFPSVA